MSITVEQLAAEFEPLAVKEMAQLPPALPPPPAPKPVAPKPATAPAAPSVTGAATDAPATAAKPATAAPVAKPVVPVAPKPAPAPAAPPPPPPKPVQIWKFEDKGLHLEVTIEPTKVVEAAQLLDRHGFAIDAVTGMDWPKQELLEVIYDFLHFQTGMRVAYRARISRKDAKIATISKVFPGADWHERETHDFFGIEFVGHRDMSPFILPEDATYHPLLKDFQA
jgi:NADH-quinone oxidoreductase subunit C